MAVLGFNFPPDSGEKVTLEITVLMSLTMFMNMVSDMQPPSSETPLIGTYFSCIMIMVASSVVCTIMILNYHHRLASTHTMPPWITIIFLQWLPWLLRMSRPGTRLTRKDILLQTKLAELEKGDKQGNALLSVLDMGDDLLQCVDSVNEFRAEGIRLPPKTKQPLPAAKYAAWLDSDKWTFPYKTGVGSDLGPDPCPESPLSPGYGPLLSPLEEETESDKLSRGGLESLTEELANIRLEITVIADKIRADAETAKIESEWKFAAMVLDRLCLLAFTAFTVILSAATLIAAPHVIVV